MPKEMLVPGVSIFINFKDSKKEEAGKVVKPKPSVLPPAPNLSTEERYRIREFCGR